MPDLLTRPLLRREEPAWGSRVPWFAAVVAAAWVLVASLALCVLPAVAVWISDGADGPLADPLRLGARIWLLSHRVGLTVDGADFTFAPLGMTILVVLLMHRSARWAAHQAGTATPRAMVAVIMPAGVTYGLGGALLAAFASSGEVSTEAWVAAGLAALWALAATTAGVVHETGYDEVWLRRVSPEVRAALAGGGTAVAGLVLVGAVLTVVATVLGMDRIGDLAAALDAGVLGNAVLAVGGGVIVPNGIIWAAGFALGPGFAIGTETVVAPDGAQLGIVPAIPALGALPSQVPGSATWLVLAGPVLVGALAGMVVRRRLAGTGEPLSVVLLAAGGSGAAAAIGMSVLALLSGGSAGAVRLATIGPVPWEVAAMTFLVVGVPAMLVVALMAWIQAARDGSMWPGRRSEGAEAR